MQETKAQCTENIVRIMRKEFGDKADLFTPVVLRLDGLDCAELEATKVPGVYVFVHEDFGCIKVGKSQSNASKRALQHCGCDNTTSQDGQIEMSHLLHCDKTYLLIFALQQTDSMHWVLALEHYLEKALNPRITSRRSG